MQIRLATPADGNAVARIYAPIVVATPISFEVDVPDGREMASRIDATIPQHPWLVAEQDGMISGYAYAGPHRTRAAYRWSVDVSVYVAPELRRGGVARRLYTVLFDVLREQGFHSAYAGITLPNPASVGFHEAMGFSPVGVFRAVGWKRGSWHDVGWWQYPLAAGSPPGEIRTVHEIDPSVIGSPVDGDS